MNAQPADIAEHAARRSLGFAEQIYVWIRRDLKTGDSAGQDQQRGKEEATAPSLIVCEICRDRPALGLDLAMTPLYI